MDANAITRRRLLRVLPAWLTTGAAWPAAAREPGGGEAGPPAEAPPALLLAREAPVDIDPAGYLVSEKYDGVRALWDGERLRFRSGAPVPAPQAFLRQLPPQPLDGELWLQRGRFSTLAGLVKRQGAQAADWAGIRYQLFELPGGRSWALDVDNASIGVLTRVGSRWRLDRWNDTGHLLGGSPTHVDESEGQPLAL